MSRSVCIGYFSKPEIDLEIAPSRDAAKAERLSLDEEGSIPLLSPFRLTG
jgi:hypothetical protein